MRFRRQRHDEIVGFLADDDPPWRAVAGQIDEIWYCTTEDEVRKQRLVDRHIRFGKTPDAARRWVDEGDEPNARLVARSSARADLIVDIGLVPG